MSTTLCRQQARALRRVLDRAKQLRDDGQTFELRKRRRERDRRRDRSRDRRDRSRDRRDCDRQRDDRSPPRRCRSKSPVAPTWPALSVQRSSSSSAFAPPPSPSPVQLQPRSAAAEPAEPPRRKRGMNLKLYCRQYAHFNECKRGKKCNFTHRSYCRKFLMPGGCTDRVHCDFKHWSICEDYQKRHSGKDCPRLPLCPFLHVIVPLERSAQWPLPGAGSPGLPGMPALPSANLPGLQPVQPSLFLPSVAPVPAQVPAPVRLVPAPAAPASPESSEDEGAEVDAAEQGEDLPEAKEEDFVIVPKAVGQFTAGAARRYGYKDYGDSGIEEDTDGDHEEDQSTSSEDDEPEAARPNRANRRKVAQRNAKPSVVPVDDGLYVPRRAPVMRHKGRRRKGDAAPKVVKLATPAKVDCKVHHKWLVTCRRCKQLIMKVDNHRICHKDETGKSIFWYRALRGRWQPTEEGGLYGGGGRGGPNRSKKQGIGCQHRLPSDWDVKLSRHRRKERRILKGKLLKKHWKFHNVEECDGNAPEMRFASQVRLERIITFRGEEVNKDDEADEDEDNLPLVRLQDEPREQDEDDLPIAAVVGMGVQPRLPRARRPKRRPKAKPKPQAAAPAQPEAKPKPKPRAKRVRRPGPKRKAEET
ncbi:unnamed protein product [Durusdinium trenchii]